MNWLVVVLRFLHIFAGVFWAGSVFTVARFVLPAAGAAGAEGQRFMRRLMLDARLTPVMVAAGTITVLAGLVLMHIDSGGHEAEWLRSGMGLMIGIGALAALGALVTGIRSAMLLSRLSKLFAAMEGKGAGGTPDAALLAQAQGLGAKLASGARATAIQLVIAVLCMAVARYVVF